MPTVLKKSELLAAKLSPKQRLNVKQGFCLPATWQRRASIWLLPLLGAREAVTLHAERGEIEKKTGDMARHVVRLSAGLASRRGYLINAGFDSL